MRAMILAAGRGERLRPITNDTPKAMVAVGGEVLIDRHLSMLADAGIDTVVVNLGWLGEQIVEHVGAGRQFGLQVVYSPEYDNVLETGGGIKRALPKLGDDPFWTINTDIYTEYKLPGDELAADCKAELVLVPRPAHKPRGDFDLVDGKVRNSETPQLIYSGIARYRPDFFSASGEGRYSVAPMLKQAADDGSLGGRLYEGVWDDVGTPERLAALNRR